MALSLRELESFVYGHMISGVGQGGREAGQHLTVVCSVII